MAAMTPAAASAARMTLDPIDDLASARDGWRSLAEASGNVFSTWEWAETWWRHVGVERPLALTACRDEGGRLAAILPLYRASLRPARVLRFVGHGPADELGPVCAPHDRSLAAAGLRRVLARRPHRFSVFVADRLRGDGWPALLAGRSLRREPSPVLPIEGRTFDAWLAGRSRNFREQVRRRERKLAREHELRMRLCSAREDLHDDFRTLVSLHRRRFGASSRAFEGPLEAFHREFAGVALERGWLRLWIMEVDGAPAAAWYGLRFAGTESYYQAGRDPALDALSPGFVLLAHTIRAAFADGMREYRFLLGDEPYKARFAERDDPLDTVAVARGPLGHGAVAAARVARRLPAPLRAHAVGLGG